MRTLRRTFRKFKKVWTSYNSWPTVPKVWAKIKLILKPMLLVASLLLTFVPVYFEQESLMKVYKGIVIPNGVSSVGLNFSDPTSVHITLPYKVENNGFFDLHEIFVKVSLKLDYTDNKGERKSQIIISERGDQGSALVGNILNEIYYKDFLDFNWGHINVYLAEVHEDEPTSVLVDVEFSFLLAGVERDWIYFNNINLTNGGESLYSTSISLNSSPKSSPAFHVNRLAFFISLVPSSFLFFILILRIKKGKKENNPKRVNIRKYRKNQFDPVRRRNLLISFRKIVIYSAIILIWDVILLFEVSGSNIYSFQYRTRYITVVISSIILMILMNINSLFPLLKPLIFKKYSLKEGMRSIFSSVLSLAILLAWASTTLISYQVSPNIFLVRDTFPSFTPIIVVAGVNIGLKIVDLINLKVFREDYRKIQILESREPSTALNKDMFNRMLLSAIQEINKLQLVATVSKIKRLLKQRGISPITDFGSKVNHAYLNTLVRKNLLDTEKKDTDESGLIVYFITIKGEGFINADSVVNDNHEEFNGHTEKLIECPNPDCRYSCDIEWLRCPICSTELVINKYCTVCGERFETVIKSNYICTSCYKLDFHIESEIHNCPDCGKEVFSKENFCVDCYTPFSPPSEKLSKLSLDKLYKLSLLFERIPKFLIIFSFQLSFTIFIFIDYLEFYGFVISYNIYSSLIIGLFLMLLIFSFQIKKIQIRKTRISRDKLYRVKLAVIRYKSELIEKTSIKKIRANQDTFRSVNNAIRKLMKKIRFWIKVITLFKFISVFILVSAVMMFFWSYIISIILIIIDLSFAYLFLFNIKIKYINDIFRLATYFDESLYEEFVIYTIKQLDYL